jgi:hypothetical protein
MFFRKLLVAMTLALLWLAACSDDESSGEVVRRIDSEGVSFSPEAFEGSIEYLPTMKAEKVRIVRLKYDLSPIDSFEVPVNTRDGDVFKVDSNEYESPYIKLVTVFPAQDDKKMEFAQYARLTDKLGKWRMNLYTAVASDRIKALMQKKKIEFEEARDSAFEELGEIFGQKIKGVDSRGYYGVDSYDCLNDMTPYVYFRHEISDSLFYSDFKKFREEFAEKGTVDSSWIITAADTWLGTFEILQDSADYLFKSISRDSDNFLNWIDEKFFSRAYGITLQWGTVDTLVQNTHKASAFYGRSFITSYHVKSGSWRSRWRLKSVLEDSLGACQYQMSYNPTKSIQRNDTIYVCRADSHIWEVITERDSLFNHQYGQCRKSYTEGKALYVHDSLFICECESADKCTWSDKYVKRVFLKSDTMYARVLDAKASSLYGRCTEEGQMEKVDVRFVECSVGTWKEIDSLHYYLGNCSYDNKKGVHLGVYYGCISEDDPWGHYWNEITPPDYYDSTCIGSKDHKVLKFDDEYYICETDICRGSDGFSASDCYENGTWRKLKDEELIPPVVDLEWCTKTVENKKLAYDGVFYECSKGKWRQVDKDDLLPPEADGLVCSDSLAGMTKRYGTYYYTCKDYKWNLLSVKESLPYLYRDSLGTCDTISNKVLHWNEDRKTFIGCTTMDSVYEWRTIAVAPSPYSLPSSYDRSKFAGEDITDSIYRVTVDAVDYRFDINKITSKENLYNLVLTNVNIAGTEYAAYLYDGRLFLHSERGKDSVLLSSIENKSECYDEFYAAWKTRIGHDNRCGGNDMVVHDDSVFVIWYDENTYVTYDKARTFCPKGYHIPDTTEFMKKFSYVNTMTNYRNDSPISWTFKKEYVLGCSYLNIIHASLFWTSTEKDFDTQYCYETTMRTATMDSKASRIVECPKDLYPMVQVMCVQDE